MTSGRSENVKAQLPSEGAKKANESVKFYIQLNSFWRRVFPGNRMHWYWQPNSRKEVNLKHQTKATGSAETVPMSAYFCGMQCSTQQFWQSSFLPSIITAKTLSVGSTRGSATAYSTELSPADGECTTPQILILLGLPGHGIQPSLPPHLTHSLRNHGSTTGSNMLKLGAAHLTGPFYC